MFSRPPEGRELNRSSRYTTNEAIWGKDRECCWWKDVNNSEEVSSQSSDQQSFSCFSRELTLLRHSDPKKEVQECSPLGRKCAVSPNANFRMASKKTQGMAKGRCSSQFYLDGYSGTQACMHSFNKLTEHLVCAITIQAVVNKTNEDPSHMVLSSTKAEKQKNKPISNVIQSVLLWGGDTGAESSKLRRNKRQQLLGRASLGKVLREECACWVRQQQAAVWWQEEKQNEN